MLPTTASPAALTRLEDRMGSAPLFGPVEAVVVFAVVVEVVFWVEMPVTVEAFTQEG